MMSFMGFGIFFYSIKRHKKKGINFVFMMFSLSEKWFHRTCEESLHSECVFHG